MGTISLEHSDRLYWLGRYTERVFTTLKTLQKLYDRTIDNRSGYAEYLGYFGLSDSYGSNRDFFRSFLYDSTNPNSVAYSLERAYDNGIVLREEISTETLSFLQLAKDTLAKSEMSENTRLHFFRLWISCMRSGAALRTTCTMKKRKTSSTAEKQWSGSTCICAQAIPTNLLKRSSGGCARD